VLRISCVTETGSLVTLKVEGALVGAWVPLLEAESLCHLDARKLVELDFAGVSFVDREGVAMMRNLIASGVQVLGASALVNALLGRSGVS
jgi:anti-anti-sigma regulatory factor